MNTTHLLTLAQACVTLLLVGLIWTMQVVHYPLFRYAEGEHFEEFHAAHAQRITWLVGLLMPAEALLAGLLVFHVPSPWTWIGAALVLALWLTTALLSIPAHQRLASGFDSAAHRRLVRTNWIRTLAWTARGLIALAMLW